MKVLLFNGSPKANGCTYTALSIVEKELNANGIDTEIIHIGNKTVKGCMGCGYCKGAGNHQCVTNDDDVNEAIIKAKEADGFVFGTPVHYASASGAITSFMDRFFMAGEKLSHKPGAVVASCRRGGASAALDQISKYFSITQMPMVTSNYWNMVHGSNPQQVLADEEGVQTMRVLGRNMAWLLKCIEAGRQAGINTPELEAKIKTDYIR